MIYPKNILFVCNANKRRSITAEFVFKQLLIDAGYKFPIEQNQEEIKVNSAGVFVNDQDYNAQQMTEELGTLADIIFTFSENISLSVRIAYKQNPRKIINLAIPDRWECGHLELIALLREKLKPYVNQWYSQTFPK